LQLEIVVVSSVPPSGALTFQPSPLSEDVRQALTMMPDAIACKALAGKLSHSFVPAMPD
jgi:hypothetical protein